MRLDELTERRLDRRSVLRTFAIGGAGVAAAAILGCSSDDDGEDDAMMEESMTATPLNLRFFLSIVALLVLQPGLLYIAQSNGLTCAGDADCEGAER